VNDATSITRKDGSETYKRSIILRDMSNKSIDLTLWGNWAENPGTGLEEVSITIIIIVINIIIIIIINIIINIIIIISLCMLEATEQRTHGAGWKR